ncbi:MAG: hypothetical protein J5532_10470 [Lachnospiraceae bacterium]|nr:hypothetical protein [Lachnospiraceae bacterium]
MGKKKVSFVCLITMTVLLVLLGNLSDAGAEKNDSSREKAINAVKEAFAQREKEAQRATIEVIETVELQDKEYAERAFESNQVYNRILEHIETDDGELRHHFAGAYINEKGNLVVFLSGEISVCRDIITSKLGGKDVVFEKGRGSYYDNMRRLDSINEALAEMQKKVVSKSADTTTCELMKMYPRARYDVYTNELYIIVNVEHQVVRMVSEKVEMQEIRDEAERKAIQIYNDKVAMLRKTLGINQTDFSVRIVPESGFEPAKDCAET